VVSVALVSVALATGIRLFIHCAEGAHSGSDSMHLMGQGLVRTDVKTLYFVKAHWELEIRAVHIPGLKNGLVDAI